MRALAIFAVRVYMCSVFWELLHLLAFLARRRRLARITVPDFADRFSLRFSPLSSLRSLRPLLRSLFRLSSSFPLSMT